MATERASRGPLQVFEATPVSINDQLRQVRDELDELHNAPAAAVSGDETVKVSANDSTAGYLNGKLVAGSGVTLTEGNDTGDETLTIAAGVDPESTLEFYEDFQGLDDTSAPGTGAARIFDHRWWGLGAAHGLAATGGQAIIDGDATTQGGLYQARTSVFNILYNTAKRFDLRFSQAQRGTSAGTRRFGLGAAQLTGDGTGIYFRHTNAGNYTAVGRTGASETTLDTGIAAANGTFHTFRLVATGATTVAVYVDETLVGTVSSGNVPTADLGIAAFAGGTGANTGMTLDYVKLRQNR